MDDRGKQLLSAALAGDENRVSELLSEVEDGTNVNYQNSDGWSPLHVAACKGHANIIRLLHQAGAELAPRTQFKLTPLHWAAYRGQQECVMLLLLLGAEIDILYPNKWTSLHWAAAKSKTDIVKLLLECGAETELKENFRVNSSWEEYYLTMTEVGRALLAQEIQRKTQRCPNGLVSSLTI